MKRRKLISYLNDNNCVLYREGKKHSLYHNIDSNKISTVPRHSEIDDLLANKICGDLGIPKIKSR